MAAKKKSRPVPSSVWAVIDGDDNKPLAWFESRRKAKSECRVFNGLEGYTANCFVVEYARVPS